eukprot:CAMPEP_0178382088 /NCGR_PEP_ID=MMETSP0689_2-20121128/6316_1 /TAXON_ID=160604 /ORGANISM="Amphidinium massartii, Strain CS-259" /LENGTH=832 /DNA_ID=CAMNT_0020002287 /DNA_START=27 /DNA_END=2525 /DNA_ORIENTATION=+
MGTSTLGDGRTPETTPTASTELLGFETGDISPSAMQWEHPPSFYCPISQQCMHDPVVLSDGHTYERRHIERWLLEHNTSPKNGLELPQKDLFPNHALRNAIEEYFQQVFSAHRRAIRRSLFGMEAQQSLGSNVPFMRTIDALMQCSLLMNAELSTGCVLRRIMDEAKQLLGAEVASVFLIDVARKELYSNVNSTGGELRIPISAGIAGHVATTGEPVVIDNAYNDARFNKDVDVKTGFKTRNMMCVPLKVKKGGVIGVVQLINKATNSVMAGQRIDHFSKPEVSPGLARIAEEPTKVAYDINFTADDLHFLQVFASQAATAVVNSGGFSEAGPPTDSQDKAGNGSSLNLFKDCLGIMNCCISNRAENIEETPPSLQKRILPESPKKGPDSMLPGIDEEQPMQATSSSSSDRHEGVSLDRAGKECLRDALTTWQLDTITLDRATNGRPLSALGMHLFVHLGLVQHFALDELKLDRYFREIEAGYSSANPYHNKAHAASVMHAMYVLLEHGNIANAACAALARDGAGMECTRMEVMLTCLLAAAVHDYEHVGLSNDFLTRSAHPRALLYNDQHVNENHHVAAAFAVLRRPELNFLENMPDQQFRQIRSLVIDLVIATDMSRHDSVLKSFVEATEGPSSPTSQASPGFLPSTNKEAVLLLQLAMKCADLGHLSLNWDLHLQWVRKIEEEFFQQGDLEKAAGMSVSFLMDRSKPGASQTQVGFFEYVVFPLFRALAQAAPSTSSALAAVENNYRVWHSLDRKDAGRSSQSVPQASTGVQSCPVESLTLPRTPQDAEGAPSVSDTSSDMTMSRKRSGRSRQRAAKWWAKVRTRTPSP